jgi:hypothetical protein
VGGGTVCTGNKPCKVTGAPVVTDTGDTRCQTAEGSVHTCLAGQTIKVTTRGCSKCPCCSANPGPQCLCTSYCGYTQTWACQ